MPEYYVTEAEQKLAELVWESGSLPSMELVRRCEERHGWKKSTTFTLLKRLQNKGLFENTDGTVRALLTREEFEAGQSHRFVSESFAGSLPRFLTAFSRGGHLSEKEIAELRALIDAQEEKA